ncbi:hypothetical protein [Undibacterium sp. Xuan67W]
MNIPNLPIKMMSDKSGSAGLIILGLLTTLIYLASRKPKQAQ